jgi:hypothetical protein
VDTKIPAEICLASIRPSLLWSRQGSRGCLFATKLKSSSSRAVEETESLSKPFYLHRKDVSTNHTLSLLYLKLF